MFISLWTLKKGLESERFILIIKDNLSFSFGVSCNIFKVNVRSFSSLALILFCFENCP